MRPYANLNVLSFNLVHRLKARHSPEHPVTEDGKTPSTKQQRYSMRGDISHPPFPHFIPTTMKKHILSFMLLTGGFLPLAAQYTIYPVPQKMTAVDGSASFSGEVCLVCDDQIDAATRQRAHQVLEEHGLKVNDTDGEQACTSVIYLKVDPSVAVSGKYDAHHLRLEAMTNGMASLTITGQHTDATFMGLASLEQMLDAAGNSALPCVDISDYADQQQRGLVEGYYGYPYSRM